MSAEAIEGCHAARDHLRHGRYADAIYELRRMLHHPSHPMGDAREVKIILAEAYLGAGRLTAAEEICRELIRSQGNDTDAHVLLTRSLRLQRRSEEAAIMGCLARALGATEEDLVR